MNRAQHAPRPLGRADFDAAFAGCHGVNTLFLTAPCHPDRRVCLKAVNHPPTAVRIDCAACGRNIVAARLAAPYTRDVQPTCHNDGIQARYTRGSGVIEVRCWVCEAVVDRLTLGVAVVDRLTLSGTDPAEPSPISPEAHAAYEALLRAHGAERVPVLAHVLAEGCVNAGEDAVFWRDLAEALDQVRGLGPTLLDQAPGRLVRAWWARRYPQASADRAAFVTAVAQVLDDLAVWLRAVRAEVAPRGTAECELLGIYLLAAGHTLVEPTRVSIDPMARTVRLDVPEPPTGPARRALPNGWRLLLVHEADPPAQVAVRRDVLIQAAGVLAGAGHIELALALLPHGEAPAQRARLQELLAAQRAKEVQP